MKNSSQWRPEMEEQTYRLALLGQTNRQIAEFFGLSISTIERWSTNHEAFRRALMRGRAEADMNVARSVYRRALGYTYVETTDYYGRDRDTGEMQLVRREETRKLQAPDVYAGLRWLALRRREVWSDSLKASVDVTYRGEVDVNLVQQSLQSLSDEELRMAMKLGLAQIPTTIDESN